MMRLPVSKYVGLVCLIACGGCGGGTFFDSVSLWFRPERDASAFTTPGQRIEYLEQLAGAAGDASPQQQQNISAQLAHTFQSEEDPLIREHLVRTLTAYRTPSASATLRAALQDSDPAVRIVAVEGIAAQQAPDAVATLGEVVRSDTDIDVRMAATRQLSSFSGPSAVAAISAALEDNDPALQYRAVQSLQAATQQDLGDDVDAWRQYVKTGSPPAQLAPSMAERLGKFRPF